jgi:hypothetical protein
MIYRKQRIGRKGYIGVTSSWEPKQMKLLGKQRRRRHWEKIQHESLLSWQRIRSVGDALWIPCASPRSRRNSDHTDGKTPSYLMFSLFHQTSFFELEPCIQVLPYVCFIFLQIAGSGNGHVFELNSDARMTNSASGMNHLFYFRSALIKFCIYNRSYNGIS